MSEKILDCYGVDLTSVLADRRRERFERKVRNCKRYLRRHKQTPSIVHLQVYQA